MANNIRPTSKKLTDKGYYGDLGAMECVMDAVKYTKQGWEVTRAVKVGNQMDLYGYNPKEFKQEVESKEVQLELPIEVELPEELIGVNEAPSEPDFNLVKSMETTKEIESYMEQFGVNISSNVKVGTAKKQAKDKWNKFVESSK